MKKHLALLLAGVLCLSVTACDKTNTDKPTDTEAPTVAVTDTDTTEPETTVTEPETIVTEPETTVTEPETTVTEPETTVTEPEETTTEPEETTTEPEETTTEPEETTTEPEETTTEPETTVILPQTPDAGQAYQDSLTFVGDSLTAHLVNREVLTGGKTTQQVWRTENSMLNLNSEVTSSKIILPGTGELMTIAQAAKAVKPSILIITLGNNWGVSYLNETDFKACYSKLVNDIKAASPNTKIILQSIFPVTTACVNLSNDKIDNANKWVKAVAAETGCRYLDTQSVLKDENNNLKAEYCNSSDGIHLGANAYQVILEYIRTHAYN